MSSLVRRQAFRLAPLVLAAPWLLLVGCDFGAKPTEPGVVARPFQGLDLKLAVSGDPEVAAAVKRMQGDWSGATGAKLTIVETDPASPLPDDCDVVVVSPGQLGALAAAKRLRPMDDQQLTRADLNWNDVYEGVRQGECRFGSPVYGLPLGVRTFVVYIRQDWLAEAKLAPPKTWADYQQLLEAFKQRPQTSGQPAVAGAIEPLGPGWAGLTLLTRAAAYSKDRGHYSTLFDIDGMQAQIASPAFVRALDELKAAAPAPETFDALKASPDDVRQAFLQGKCGVALAWPARRTPETDGAAAGAGSEASSSSAVAPEAASIHAVPGSPDVYNLSTKAWKTRKRDEAIRVSLAGVEGRFAAVSAASKHPEAAFELAAALVGGRWGKGIRLASLETGPCRQSDQAEALAWVVDPAERGAATQYVDAVGEALAAPERLDALRIPGRERYLAALDLAVQRVVRGEAESAAALSGVAREWEAITEELGRDRQAAAYRKSVAYE